MIVLVLTAVPPGLRGHVTRWLLEISAGVYVGKLPKRTRDRLWARVVDMLSQGRAIMIMSANNEQGLDFRVHGHHWEPIDFDGVQLMLRPAEGDDDQLARPHRDPGWSNAAKRRRYRR